MGSDHYPIYTVNIPPVSDNGFDMESLIRNAIAAILALCGVGGAIYFSIVEDMDLINWLREQYRNMKPKHMGSMDDCIRHADIDGWELRVVNKFAYTYNQWAHAEPDVLIHAMH